MDINKFKIDNQRHLVEFFKKVESLISPPEMYGQINGQLIFSKSASYVFTHEAKIYWDEFLLRILTLKDLQNYVSIKTIDDEFKPLLENYLIDKNINPTDLNEKISNIEKYRINKNFHYFIVSNFLTEKVLRFSNIKIGKFEEVCPKTGFSFAQKINSNTEAIVSYHKLNNSYNDSFFRYYFKELEKLNNQTVLEVYNYGDQILSEQKSIQNAEHFINELIFLRSLCSNLEFKIELNADTIQSLSSSPIQINYYKQSLRTSPIKLIYPTKLNFNDKNDSQTNIGSLFKNLAFPIFQEGYNDELLEKLKTAIDWYASSFKAKNNRESFLFCAIGMEALLSNGRDAITKTLAENTAFLIAKKDIKSRKTVFNKIIYLYQRRSGIAHGGTTNIEITDLQQIRFYLSKSIILIIEKIQDNEINSVKELFEYLENQKFG